MLDRSEVRTLANRYSKMTGDELRLEGEAIFHMMDTLLKSIVPVTNNMAPTGVAPLCLAYQKLTETQTWFQVAVQLHRKFSEQQGMKKAQEAQPEVIVAGNTNEAGEAPVSSAQEEAPATPEATQEVPQEAQLGAQEAPQDNGQAPEVQIA